MMVGIDGTPAIRQVVTGTEVYARSIIDALAASRGPRTMRVYANAVDEPPWLPAGLEWRGVPFSRPSAHPRAPPHVHPGPARTAPPSRAPAPPSPSPPTTR